MSSRKSDPIYARPWRSRAEATKRRGLPGLRRPQISLSAPVFGCCWVCKQVGRHRCAGAEA